LLEAILARAAAIFCCILSIAMPRSGEVDNELEDEGEHEGEEPLEEEEATGVGRNSRADKRKTSPPEETISSGK